MKYKQIYQVLEKHDVKIAHDNSGWRYATGCRLYGQQIHPLWIVAEAPLNSLRLWITHSAGKLSVTTANLALPSGSREYHLSHTCRSFRTQKELAGYLEELLGNSPVDAT